MDHIEYLQHYLSKLNEDIAILKSIYLSLNDKNEEKYDEQVMSIENIKESITRKKCKFIEETIAMTMKQKLEKVAYVNQDIKILQSEIEFIKDTNYDDNIRNAYNIISKYIKIHDKYTLVHPCENNGYYILKKNNIYKSIKYILNKYINEMCSLYDNTNNDINSLKVVYIDSII